MSRRLQHGREAETVKGFGRKLMTGYSHGHAKPNAKGTVILVNMFKISNVIKFMKIEFFFKIRHKKK
jgi:hypothetical protein